MTQQLRECLAQGTARSWKQFIDLVRPVIKTAVVRKLASARQFSYELADDLVQETFVRLCVHGNRALRNFQGTDDATLQAWLNSVASSVVADHLKSLRAVSRGGGQQFQSLDDPETESVADSDSPIEEGERHQMREQIDEWLEAESERDRRIFWLYHREGFSPAEIAAHPGMGVGKGGVETIVYRLTKKVAARARRSVPIKGASLKAEGVGL